MDVGLEIRHSQMLISGRSYGREKQYFFHGRIPNVTPSPGNRSKRLQETKGREFKQVYEHVRGTAASQDRAGTRRSSVPAGRGLRAS